jgi:hypothetical protein
MISKVYGKYFQKSRSFLYPILGLRREKHTIPLQTYISVEGVIEAVDIKLICTFNDITSKEFKVFENEILNNKFFAEKLEIGDDTLYVFDIQEYANDYFNFILGKYSKLSDNLKKAIKKYYGDKSLEYEYMDCYLYPEKYFELYAKMLDVNIFKLQKVGELCDSCDIEKETFKISKEEPKLLDKNL